MAKLTVAENFSFDQTSFDFSNLFYGSSYARSSTLFRVNYSDGVSEEFRGTGFKYDAYGVPYAGTVTSYGATYNGQRLFLVEGGSVSASSIVAAADTWNLSDDAAVIMNVLRGNDTLTGGNLADIMMGYDGDDVINGNGGDDDLYGDAGNDTIIGGKGADWIYGGAGSDTASYATASTRVSASLLDASSNTNDAKGDAYYDVENLLGSRFNDVLTGNAGGNVLMGGDGNDTLIGGASGDRLYGGNGSDTASYASASAGVSASLAAPKTNSGDAKGDIYSSIENLSGSRFNDVLAGDATANVLAGGSGNDTLEGAAGGDVLNGGAGSDTASYVSASASVKANLADAASNTRDAKGDTYHSIENLLGSSFGDALTGDAGVNALSGGGGHDVLSGGLGNDSLFGGAGADRHYGGAGTDRFIFKAISESVGSYVDTIFDFSTSELDRIDLSAIDASTMSAGDQAFSFIGANTFTGVAGQLRFDKLTSDTYIYADVNGDTVADFKVHLDDAITLTKDYFIV